MSAAAIQARELGRWYGQVVGLNDLTVEIEAPVTGLLGPNGAGKSTFLKLVAGEIRPSRGQVRVLGEDPFANPRLFQRLGFCPQQDALYEQLTGLEFVTLLMRLSGYDRREAKARAERALDRVELTEASNRPTRTYSKGMRQRARLAQAIAHQPALLIADEPLTGLDPIMRHKTTELFRSLAEEGTQVVISSHVLHEVEALTDEIVLIHRGRLLAQGSVVEVRDLISRHPRRIEIEARDARRLAGAVIELDEVRSVSVDGEAVQIETKSAETFFRAFTALAARGDFGVRSLLCSDENLESVFDYLVQ